MPSGWVRARDALSGVLSLGVGLVLAQRLTPAAEAKAPSPSAPATPSAVPLPLASPTLAPPTLAPAPTPDARPAPVASYTIEARLDAATHRVNARQSLVFVNRSIAPVRELYFHLYLNAFKNEASIFLRAPFGEARGSLRASDWGYIDVSSLSAPAQGGANLWPTRTPGTPEEPEDETDVRVPLPAPIPPGQSLTLELEFAAKLPTVVLRTGYVDDFHFVGQWFPKLARLEPDGHFAHFPFHAQAEFYADYGDYDVTLDVPKDAVVGATGVRVEREERGERRRERYRAERVHDFAWTAWSGFQEQSARIDGVDVRLLFPLGYDGAAARTLGALRFALPRASRLYGTYPYPNLTVVHPPERASEAGGMEYPTLITTGGPWYAGMLGDRALEAVTIHELLHQWFYGLVATNEARSPFLDEGLTSYAELEMLDAGFGSGSAFDAFDLRVSATSLARGFAAARAEDVPVASPAAEFPSFRTLGALVYSRTAALLETLARVYGRERFLAALGSYARRYRFAHPTPADFINLMSDELGADAGRVLDEALERRGRVDFLVRELQNAPEKPAAGVFDRENGRETVPVTSGDGARFRARAVILRHGSLELPVEIELTDANGAKRRERWDGHGPLYVVDWRGEAPLAHVVVDPDHRIVLDDDLLNNAASAAPAGSRRSVERASYWSELALAFFWP